MGRYLDPMNREILSSSSQIDYVDFFLVVLHFLRVSYSDYCVRKTLSRRCNGLCPFIFNNNNNNNNNNKICYKSQNHEKWTFPVFSCYTSILVAAEWSGGWPKYNFPTSTLQCHFFCMNLQLSRASKSAYLPLFR